MISHSINLVICKQQIAKKSKNTKIFEKNAYICCVMMTSISKYYGYHANMNKFESCIQGITCGKQLKYVSIFQHKNATVFTKTRKKLSHRNVIIDMIISSSPKYLQKSKFKIDSNSVKTKS